MRGLDSFEIIFAVGLTSAFALRFRERLRHRARVAESKRDGLELMVLLLAFSGMLAIPVVHLTTTTLLFANYGQSTSISIFGALVFSGALVLLWRSHADLGRNWSESLELMQSHQLVTNGIYRLMRHPMYAAIWLWGLAQALLLRNYIAGFSALDTLRAPVFHPSAARGEDDARAFRQAVCGLYGAHKAHFACSSKMSAVLVSANGRLW